MLIVISSKKCVFKENDALLENTRIFGKQKFNFDLFIHAFDVRLLFAS